MWGITYFTWDFIIRTIQESTIYKQRGQIREKFIYVHLFRKRGNFKLKFRQNHMTIKQIKLKHK